VDILDDIQNLSIVQSTKKKKNVNAKSVIVSVSAPHFLNFYTVIFPVEQAEISEESLQSAIHDSESTQIIRVVHETAHILSFLKLFV